jgi:hypothetical protein
MLLPSVLLAARYSIGDQVTMTRPPPANSMTR